MAFAAFLLPQFGLLFNVKALHLIAQPKLVLGTDRHSSHIANSAMVDCCLSTRK
jgi:hypothetical protein